MGPVQGTVIIVGMRRVALLALGLLVSACAYTSGPTGPPPVTKIQAEHWWHASFDHPQPSCGSVSCTRDILLRTTTDSPGDWCFDVTTEYGLPVPMQGWLAINWTNTTSDDSFCVGLSQDDQGRVTAS